MVHMKKETRVDGIVNEIFFNHKKKIMSGKKNKMER